MIIYSVVVLLIALLPVAMFLKNSMEFVPANSDPELLRAARSERISILIPARNESASIGPAIDALLQNDHPGFEVLVLDDHSEEHRPSHRPTRPPCATHIVQSVTSRLEWQAACMLAIGQ